MSNGFVSTIEELKAWPKFTEGWSLAGRPLIMFLTEKVISSAKAGNPEASKTLALLLEDLRSLGFSADPQPAPPAASTPTMPKLKTMP